MKKIGIIGGSGFNQIEGIETLEHIEVSTDHGNPSASIQRYRIEDLEIYLLRRHGINHTIAPHKINYRANIEAFSNLGIDKIIAFGASGAIDKSYKLGSLVLSSDAIDMTKNRESTFFDKDIVAHIDMSVPFCPNLQKAFLKSAKDANVEVTLNGIAICTEGPRIETPSEIKFFEKIGATTVGMTLFPELALAREKGICYISVAIISNYAAGIEQNKITADMLIENSRMSSESINKIALNLHKYIEYNKNCPCENSIEGTVLNAN